MNQNSDLKVADEARVIEQTMVMDRVLNRVAEVSLQFEEVKI